jgi:hypothetical protein
MEKGKVYSPNNKGYCIVCSFLMLVSNIVLIFWTIALSIEQIETGWGYTTDLELLVLVPFILSILTIPIIIMELVFLPLSYFFRVTRQQFLFNVITFFALILQIILINLFIFY